MTQSLSGIQTLSVFQHQKRHEWGLAVLAWETRNKRGYVFENGQLRVLVEPFFAMMRQVECPRDEIEALHKTLQPELDAARAELGSYAQPRRAGTQAPASFDDQRARFRAAFPHGFEDALWVEQQRGSGASKRLMAHRDPAIAEAEQLLDTPALEARIAAHDYRGFYDAILALLSRTDLVPAAEIASMRGADASGQRAVTLMVAELLRGNGEYGTRVEHFVSAFHTAFGKLAGWQLSTVLPALLEPNECVVVRPSMFRRQAKWMAPGTSLSKWPSAAGYRRCLSMAQELRARLEERGEKPRDLLDVHDFIRVTMQSTSKRAASK